MSAVELFTYRSQEVRTVLIDGDPWFVAADACKALTIRDTSSAMKMVDEEDRRTLYRSDTPHLFDDVAPQVQMLVVINEPGLYALIFQSDKGEAKAFRYWLTHDVLPQIRRTGTYSSAPALEGPELLARAVLEAQTMLAAKDERIAELEPKAEVADRLLDADGDLSVRDAAQSLTRAGVKVGQNRLFTVLERKGWVRRAAGDNRYRVMQSAIEAGYMSVLPQSHYHPRTGVLVVDPPQPRVTPKGLQRLLTEHGAAA